MNPQQVHDETLNIHTSSGTFFFKQTPMSHSWAQKYASTDDGKCYQACNKRPWTHNNTWHMTKHWLYILFPNSGIWTWVKLRIWICSYIHTKDWDVINQVGPSSAVQLNHNWSYAVGKWLLPIWHYRYNHLPMPWFPLICVGTINLLRPRQNGRPFPDYTFLKAFSWIKLYEFRLIFYWGLIPRIQLTIFPHLFR